MPAPAKAARVVSLTAIGDSVNTASRLESLAKDLGVELVVSENVAQRAGIEARSPAHWRDGRSPPLAAPLVTVSLSPSSL